MNEVTVKENSICRYQGRRHYFVDERQVGLTPSDVVRHCAHALIAVIAVVRFKYHPLKREGFLSVREYVNLIAYRWWSVTSILHGDDQ